MFSGVRILRAVRTKTSLIPPNVSSLKEIGRLESKYPQAHPELFERMSNFYRNVAKGPAPKLDAKTFGDWYRQRYLQKNSGMPLLHIIFGTMCLGYYSAMVVYGVFFILIY